MITLMGMQYNQASRDAMPGWSAERDQRRDREGRAHQPVRQEVAERREVAGGVGSEDRQRLAPLLRRPRRHETCTPGCYGNS